MTSGSPQTELPSDEQGWDSICARCGRCCYEKLDYRGRIYYTRKPCEFLDPETRLCKVYAERHLQRPGCVPLSPEVIEAGILPDDCPYVLAVKCHCTPGGKSK